MVSILQNTEPEPTHLASRRQWLQEIGFEWQEAPRSEWTMRFTMGKFSREISISETGWTPDREESFRRNVSANIDDLTEALKYWYGNRFMPTQFKLGLDGAPMDMPTPPTLEEVEGGKDGRKPYTRFRMGEEVYDWFPRHDFESGMRYIILVNPTPAVNAGTQPQAA